MDVPFQGLSEEVPRRYARVWSRKAHSRFLFVKLEKGTSLVRNKTTTKEHESTILWPKAQRKFSHAVRFHSWLSHHDHELRSCWGGALCQCLMWLMLMWPWFQYCNRALKAIFLEWLFQTNNTERIRRRARVPTSHNFQALALFPISSRSTPCSVSTSLDQLYTIKAASRSWTSMFFTYLFAEYSLGELCFCFPSRRSRGVSQAGGRGAKLSRLRAHLEILENRIPYLVVLIDDMLYCSYTHSQCI